ncbi:MAG: PD40 domain-containing protein [Flavobacteriaceae bacterium]|nr:PD40 domain-containing protein [Flavobacteriaceae bacterium]
MKSMKYLAPLVLFLFLGTAQVFSQKGNIKQADEDFEYYAYIDSRAIYLRVVGKGYSSAEIYQKLGDSYYFTGDLKSASQWYKRLVSDYGQVIAPEYFFRYAQTLKRLEDYEEADIIMERFIKAKGDDYRGILHKNTKNYLDLISEKSGLYKLSEISGVNTAYSEFAPAFYNEGIIYASNKPDGNTSGKIHQWDNLPYYDLYSVMTSRRTGAETGMFTSVNSKFHESTAVVTKDGKTLYFTRNNYTKNRYRKDKKGTNLLKLYRSKLIGNSWSEAEELPFNSNEYSVAHPALSPDGKTLYFASDMPGGKGLSDLYKVAIEGDGFGTPENLDSTINTEGRETFPFIDAKGNLYYSSDGHVGLGGLDIFMIQAEEDGSFGQEFIFGEPINSSADDFTFIIDIDKKTGYFASNREGVIGADDIYSFIELECEQSLTGIVRDKKTEEPIGNALVELRDKDNNLISEQVASHTGVFDFGTIKCSGDYTIRAHRMRYDSNEISFTAPDKINAKLDKTIFLQNRIIKEIPLEPIYFDLDKSFIRPDAEVELQKVIAFLELNPSINIDVRSHTDSRANDAYNIALSQRRNKATIKYIVEIGGIASNRLTGRGYGETQLVNHRSNGVKCSKAEHQKNRRSQFILVKK